MLYLCPHKAHTDYRNFIIKPMNIQELLNRTDRFAANAGCKITEVDTEHAVAEMVVTTAHLNGANVCQGGALFTLADLAIAALMNAHGQLTVGISNSIMLISHLQYSRKEVPIPHLTPTNQKKRKKKERKETRTNR